MSEFVFSCCGKEQCDGCAGNCKLIKKSEWMLKKIAAMRQQPFWQRALASQLQQPSWDTSKGLFENLGANIAQAKQQGQRWIAEERQADRLRALLQPGFARQRFQKFLREGDPNVTDPFDRIFLDGQNL
jgi:hypothetical protein